MPDMEKVIKGLEVCRDQDNPPGYRFTSCVDDCPYHENGCARKLKEDALDMMKEQEAVVRCKDCKWNSGTAEKPFCMMRSVPSPADWFCADGERKK